MDYIPVKARLLPYKGLVDSLRIVLEVPLEQAADVTEKLGWPSPGKDIWVAIVRLEDAATGNDAEKDTPSSPPPYLENV